TRSCWRTCRWCSRGRRCTRCRRSTRGRRSGRSATRRARSGGSGTRGTSSCSTTGGSGSLLLLILSSLGLRLALLLLFSAALLFLSGLALGLLAGQLLLVDPATLRGGQELRGARCRQLAVDQDGLAEHLGDIQDLGALALVFDVCLTVVHAVVDHRLTERATNRNGVRAGSQRLVRAVQVDAGTEVLLPPHAGTTSATAEAGAAVARHLGELSTGGADQLTRGVEDLVVTAQEARVVVGHGTAGVRRVHRLQVALLDQLVQQLGVVDDLVVTAHLRVFVAQGVEAVSTGNNDLALLRRHALEGVVQGLDVLLSQHLEEELVTGTAGGVTRAAFVLAQDGELHTSGVQQLRDRA